MKNKKEQEKAQGLRKVEYQKYAVPAEELLDYTSFLPKLAFKDTSELPRIRNPIQNFFNQPKVKEALGFGLEIRDHGHIFVTGHSGIGRNSFVTEFLANFIKKATQKNKAQQLKDICCVYNLSHPDQPLCFLLKKGLGKFVKENIESLPKEFQTIVGGLITQEEYKNTSGYKAIEDPYQKSIKEILKITEAILKKKFLCKYEVVLDKDKQGRDTVFVFFEQDGHIIYLEEYQKLSKEKQEELNEKYKDAYSDTASANLLIDQLQEKRKEAILSLIQKLVTGALSVYFYQLLETIKTDFRIKDNKEIKEFLSWFKRLNEYCIDNFYLFLPKPKKQVSSTEIKEAGQITFSQQEKNSIVFSVTLINDCSDKNYLPIIYEPNPSFKNLFGSIEVEYIDKRYYSDHSMVRSGSILKANGGYLVLKAEDLLVNANWFVTWKKLKETLINKSLNIQNIRDYLELNGSVVLQPKEIPIDIKLIIVGESQVYDKLAEADKDFLHIFKTKVEIDNQNKITQGHINGCVNFISQCCYQDHLRPLRKKAVAKILELMARRGLGHFSINLSSIRDLLRESNYWAGKLKKKTIQYKDVIIAIKAKRRRNNLWEEKYQEMIKERKILIDTSGQKVGQVNALGIISGGESQFGLPMKLTALPYAGTRGIISVQRGGLAGKIYNMSVDIISAFLKNRYAEDKRFPLEVSLCYEQVYGGIDGDSGSLAQIVAIVSALSRLPAKQNLAITGSLNQLDEGQSVGGTTEKIEGFFDVCQRIGLNGDQGVVVPRSNLKGILLKEDVMKAIKDKHFWIYAVDNAEEAIELMTGFLIQDVDKTVINKLWEEHSKGSKKIGFFKNLYKKITNKRRER